MKKKLWSQSIARASLLGHETETMNPSIAAKSLLGRDVVTRATRKLFRYGRRRAYRGNPLPALIGALGSLGGLGKRFKAPSEKRAAAIAPAIIAAANSGNLTAARGLIERAAWPMIAKEWDVWKAAAAQLAPKMRAAVTKYAELIPAASQRNPEEFAASIAASPVQLAQIEGQEREERATRGAAAERRAARDEEAAERREGRLTELGAAGLQALAGRGRRPARRRRRRTPRLY